MRGETLQSWGEREVKGESGAQPGGGEPSKDRGLREWKRVRL